MCDRLNANVEGSQVYFIDYIVHPLWETWADLVHPDAQRILENLEDNREWFASQLPPDSPSSLVAANEDQLQQQQQLQETEQQQLDEDVSGSLDCSVEEHQSQSQSQQQQQVEDEMLTSKSETDEIMMTTSSDTIKQRLDSGPEDEVATTANECDDKSTGDSPLARSKQKQAESDVRLQVQADKIQFQITLDEPGPEMMTHHDTTSATTTKTKQTNNTKTNTQKD